MTSFFVIGAVIFALLFILLGYFLGNYEAKKVYRELLCHRQDRICELQRRVDALVRQAERRKHTSTYRCGIGATVADLTRWLNQSVTDEEHNYYVRMIRKAGSALMRTPLRTEHVHADNQCKQQDVPAFWP